MRDESHHREQLTTTIRSDLLREIRHLMIDMGVKAVNELLEECFSCLLAKKHNCDALKRLSERMGERDKKERH